ncbi:MAG: hypothetical protein GEU75_03450 [Dehalococcoidia bacterium]|nr:hypothetical protein [Dehalococcoidia bacterium]
MPVIDFQITGRKPLASGQEFGAAGAYEQIDGSVTFAVDPRHKANETIVDLDLAPHDTEGRVRFRSDFSLLVPKQQERGNGRVMVELVNRGRRLAGRLNRAPADAPLYEVHPGDGFLFRRGWSVASIGWQWDVPDGGPLLHFDAPPVLEKGAPLTGSNVVTIRPSYPGTTFLLANRVHKTYAASDLDDPDATLLVRDYEDGEDTLIARDRWRFASEAPDGSVTPSREHVYMASGFEPGKVYNLVYRAAGARVVGAGLLAFRDIGSFLRRPSALNPVAGFDWVYGHGVSQTGRMLRHFLYLGLNLDEGGGQVYDGLLVHVAGARRGEFNHRFAQPSVQTTPNFGHLFPFADEDAIDPYNEREGGLLRRQRALGGVPKVFYTNTSAEYWRGDAALLHTDALGKADLTPAPETRIYHFGGTQHMAGVLPQGDINAAEGIRGRYGFNVVDYAPLLRSALVNLDAWTSQDVEPPPSVHGRIDDGTLVSEPEALQGFAGIPSMALPDPERMWAIRELDLGPDAARGIGDYPAKAGRFYGRMVAAVDADGNETAGIRLPDLTAPVATNTGWNPRHPETGGPEQIISMMGFTRFFPATKSEREASGDPRPSIEERYAGKDAYLARVREEAKSLVEKRHILAEDIEILVSNASARYDAALGATEGEARAATH